MENSLDTEREKSTNKGGAGFRSMGKKFSLLDKPLKTFSFKTIFPNNIGESTFEPQILVRFILLTFKSRDRP